ncbi:hypothetical protein MRB53_028844 [Persea americana]|uniref:Uncharacterized protein n=1 Tax=Persea americana TaxID=3435 RepID=A0ACC2KGN7_PERAE|nr:hypothetical protein MRB53_028844 [Persea americana]
MDVREMGSVRWVLKGRDGAWRRWVVRDEEEMMMGCCVREMGRRGGLLKLGDGGSPLQFRQRILSMYPCIYDPTHTKGKSDESGSHVKKGLALERQTGNEGTLQVETNLTHFKCESRLKSDPYNLRPNSG